MRNHNWGFPLRIYSVLATIFIIFLLILVVSQKGKDTLGNTASILKNENMPTFTISISSAIEKEAISFPVDPWDPQKGTETLFFNPAIWRPAIASPDLLQNKSLPECAIRSRFLSEGLSHVQEWREFFAGLDWQVIEAQPQPGWYLREYYSRYGYLSLSFINAAGREFGDSQILYRWRQCNAMAMDVFQTIQFSGMALSSSGTPSDTDTPLTYGQCIEAPESRIWKGDLVGILRDAPWKTQPLASEVSGFFRAEFNNQGNPMENFRIMDGPICGTWNNESVMYWNLSLVLPGEETYGINGWVPEADSQGRFFGLILLGGSIEQ